MEQLVCPCATDVVLFTSDRGIAPGRPRRGRPRSAGSTRSTCPSTPTSRSSRDAAHPGTGDETLPDDRYLRTLDPWVSLATAAAVTSRSSSATAVALPVESDPITLAKTIATLDHLSGGRVTLGAGFGWNTDELADHGVPAKRRTALREYSRRCGRCGPRTWRRTTASSCRSAPLGLPEAGPGASRWSRRRRRPEDLRLDRRQRRRLDHHPDEQRHRRPGRALQQGLGDAGREGEPESAS